MSLLVRGILGFGAYLALALAPLLVAAAADPIAARRPFAVELGVALGYVAYALIAIELALVARLRGASRPFGTDALMLFHRQMGLAAAAFLVAHVALLVAAGPGPALFDPRSGPLARSGLVGLVAVLGIVATSLGRRRWRLRYETWLGLHRAGALVAVVALVAHVLAAHAYARAPAVRAVLLGYAGLFLALGLQHRVVRPLRLRRRPWEIAENRDEGADTRTLVLRPVGHPGFAFEPGQFAWLLTGRSPFRAQEHPLSFSSSAERAPGGEVELSIKALGDWSSTAVPALAPGERVWLDGPFGAFTPGRDDRAPLVLVAGGVGVTPMRAILLTLRDRGDRRTVVLIYATHDPSRAVFGRDLAELERDLDLRVVRVHEAPPPGWTGERGFVTADVLRRHVPGDPRRARFLVCGPAPMMDAMERVLVDLGVPPSHVRTERFDLV